MIGGQSSFQYGGYWFGLANPWPAGWQYTDPVYVDYVDGGYVLVNHEGLKSTAAGRYQILAHFLKSTRFNSICLTSLQIRRTSSLCSKSKNAMPYP